MKRIDIIRSQPVETIAELIVQYDLTDAFCKGDCGAEDCPHPTECCVKWLESDERICRICGCTHFNACEGGCYWVEDDLCSRCAEKMKKEGAESA